MTQKCFKSVYGSLDYHSLQLDIHLLSLWSLHWKLCFNEQKCVSIHFPPEAMDVNNTYYT